jgi:hypothetical protein
MSLRNVTSAPKVITEYRHWYLCIYIAPTFLGSLLRDNEYGISIANGFAKSVVTFIAARMRLAAVYKLQTSRAPRTAAHTVLIICCV